MRSTYWLWAVGLLLKGIGASWDVAWHFRTLRETVSPPHIVNTLGGIVCAYALYLEWRQRDARRTGPLLVIMAGVAIFLLAMPFDQWWHMRFGIDLTTWSPAHLMLFGGTAVSVFGVLLLYVTDLSAGRDPKSAIRGATTRERLMLVYLLVFLAGALYFPLTYNEYTTVAARVAFEAPETMDPALVEIARNADDAVFLNTPTWLYPAYSVAMAAFLGTLVRAWLGRGWALVALVGLSAERAVADGVLTGLGWPGAALPLQFVGIGVLVELVWLPRAHEAARALATGVASAVAGYAYFVYPLTWKDAVPLTAASWPIGLSAALVAALVGLFLARRGLRVVADVPHFELRDVQAWVAAQVRR